MRTSTRVAPAPRTIQTISRSVVPRTIESSRRTTRRPLRSPGTGWSFTRTSTSRRFWSGRMNVRSTNRFLIKRLGVRDARSPSENPSACGRAESGYGDHDVGLDRALLGQAAGRSGGGRRRRSVPRRRNPGGRSRPTRTCSGLASPIPGSATSAGQLALLEDEDLARVDVPKRGARPSARSRPTRSPPRPPRPGCRRRAVGSRADPGTPNTRLPTSMTTAYPPTSSARGPPDRRLEVPRPAVLEGDHLRHRLRVGVAEELDALGLQPPPDPFEVDDVAVVGERRLLVASLTTSGWAFSRSEVPVVE